MGKPPVAAATRADGEILNVLGVYACPHQQPTIGIWKIEMHAAGSGCNRCIGGVTGHGAPSGNNLVADLVTAGTNSGSDHGDDTFGLGPEGIDHRFNRSTRNI